MAVLNRATHIHTDARHEGFHLQAHSEDERSVQSYVKYPPPEPQASAGKE